MLEGVVIRNTIFESPLPGWLSGEHVGVMTCWLCIRDLAEPRFLSGIFSLLTSAAKHVRKVVGGFGEKYVLVVV